MKKLTINSILSFGAAGVAVWLALDSRSQAQSSLLPFQGRLTDATGLAVPDGAKVVEFKIYDAPTGGTVKWAGEVHRLSVNGGLVNTMLGSKASLGGVDFSAPRYLQITVDANGDDQITAADPPLLPRQSVVPAVYAVESGNSRKLNNADWSAILTGGGNDPVAGTLRGDKLAAGSVNTPQLAAGAVKSAQLDSNSVATSQIVDGTIQTRDLSVGLQQGIIPTGTVMAFAGKEGVPPPGWAFCDGRSVLKNDPIFSELFEVIGTIHGTNDSTSFNLPDYRGRFLRGVDDSDGPGGLAAAKRDPDVTARTALGSGTPESVGSVQDDAFQKHNHKVYATASGATAHQSIRYIPEIGNLNYYTNVFTRDNAPTDFYAAEELPGARAKEETRPQNAYVNFLIKL